MPLIGDYPSVTPFLEDCDVVIPVIESKRREYLISVDAFLNKFNIRAYGGLKLFFKGFRIHIP